MDKIWVITRKEWSEVFKNRFVLFTVAFLPLILTALPLAVLYFTSRSGDLAQAGLSDMPESFRALCGGLDGGECAQYFFISQFMLLFMLMPLAIPVTIASYSIIGEKTTRTLEPVLATPITTVELLLGKALAALIPAVLATWGGFTAFALGAALMRLDPQVLSRLVDPLWLTAVLVVGPLLAMAGVSVAVMVSSRANDPRVAEQLSMLVILPLLGVFFGQLTGLFFIDDRFILAMALVLALLDSGLLYFAVRLFQRETILTRWK